MKLPNWQRGVIEQAKLITYLLSPSHPLGHHKAAFFLRCGFSVDKWYKLARALKRHAGQYDVAKVEESPFGRRYVVEGELTALDGRDPRVRAVRFIETGEDVPRFVTAYPLEKM